MIASTPILKFEAIIPINTLYRIISFNFKVCRNSPLLNANLTFLAQVHIKQCKYNVYVWRNVFVTLDLTSCSIMIHDCCCDFKHIWWLQHESTSCFNYIWGSWDVIDNFVRQNSGLHNLNTKFCMCWHGILHPQATISLYVDLDCVQVVVCC